MKIINKINPRISAFKFKDEVRGFLINSLLKNEKILAFYRIQLSCIVVGFSGSFGKTISKEMEESAYMDGAGFVRT